VTERRARELLVFALAASAGAHAALVPAHAAEGAAVAALFALAAAAAGATAVVLDRRRDRAPLALAAMLLAALLAIYAVSRTVAVWPLPHAEPVDALGAMTKLCEAAGLLLALRLLQTSADGTPSAARPIRRSSP
jgi:disulfide bond formation protein DsbB